MKQTTWIAKVQSLPRHVSHETKALGSTKFGLGLCFIAEECGEGKFTVRGGGGGYTPSHDGRMWPGNG